VRFNRFDLNLLLALEALLREKSVTRAAEQLFVSQPAMSAALAKLRAYFADQLLVRVGRDLELTPRGRSLLDPVSQMLANMQTVLGPQEIFDPLVEKRTFTIISPSDVTPWVLQPLMRKLEMAAPGIRIQVERPTVPGLARLAQGNVDMVLTLDGPDSLPLPNLPESICMEYLLAVRYVAIITANHPEIESELTLEQYLRLPHAVAHTFRNYSLVEETAQKNFGAHLDVRAITESVLEIPYLVQQTSMIGVIPHPLARVFKDVPRFKVLELPSGTMPSSRLDMLWHRSFQPDASHAWIRAAIMREVVERSGASWDPTRIGGDHTAN
jgi:LysR family transcriptional regulator, nod-box dependent transcriptional activator